MIDRVRFPDGNGGYSETDLIGFVGIDGTSHAVLRLNNGKYRTVTLLHIERLANPHKGAPWEPRRRSGSGDAAAPAGRQMIAVARVARGQAMRCIGSQISECALDQMRLGNMIVRREHEAGLLYRACWLSDDPYSRALCGVIDQELELRFDCDGPVILRSCAIHNKKPHSPDGLDRLRRCLARSATTIETLCGELNIAAD